MRKGQDEIRICDKRRNEVKDKRRGKGKRRRGKIREYEEMRKMRKR